MIPDGFKKIASRILLFIIGCSLIIVPIYLDWSWAKYGIPISYSTLAIDAASIYGGYQIIRLAFTFF